MFCFQRTKLSIGLQNVAKEAVNASWGFRSHKVETKLFITASGAEGESRRLGTSRGCSSLSYGDIYRLSQRTDAVSVNLSCPFSTCSAAINSTSKLSVITVHVIGYLEHVFKLCFSCVYTVSYLKSTEMLEVRL